MSIRFTQWVYTLASQRTFASPLSFSLFRKLGNAQAQLVSLRYNICIIFLIVTLKCVLSRFLSCYHGWGQSRNAQSYWLYMSQKRRRDSEKGREKESLCGRTRSGRALVIYSQAKESPRFSRFLLTFFSHLFLLTVISRKNIF